MIKVFIPQDKTQGKTNVRGLIKRLLRDYKGLTIYVKPEGYLLEVYYN